MLLWNGLFNDRGLNQVPKILRQKCPFPNKPDYGKNSKPKKYNNVGMFRQNG